MGSSRTPTWIVLISDAAASRPISPAGRGHRGQPGIGDRGERDPVEADDPDVLGDPDPELAQLVHQGQGQLVVVAHEGLGQVGRDLRGEIARRPPGVAGCRERAQGGLDAPAPEGRRDRFEADLAGCPAAAFDVGNPAIAVVDEVVDGGPHPAGVVGQDDPRGKRALAPGQAAVIGLDQDQAIRIDPLARLPGRDRARYDRHAVGAVLGKDLQGQPLADRLVLAGDHDHAVAAPAGLLLEARRDLAVDRIAQVGDQQAQRRVCFIRRLRAAALGT